MPVIGFLGNTSPGPYAALVAAFHQGVIDAGFVEGQNVAVEYRWAEGSYERLPAMATDLVARRVDVIAAGGLASARAAKTRLRRSAGWPEQHQIGSMPNQASPAASAMIWALLTTGTASKSKVIVTFVEVLVI